MNSLENKTQSAVKIALPEPEKPTVYRAPVVEVTPVVTAPVAEIEDKMEAPVLDKVQEKPTQGESTAKIIRESFFDKYVTRIKEFLDKAE